MDEFYRTVGGRRFIEGTMPRLVEELARLNANLEAILTELRRSVASDSSPPPPTAGGVAPTG